MKKLILLLIVLSATALLQAEPTNRAWTGGGDGITWGDSANWSGGVPDADSRYILIKEGSVVADNVDATASENLHIAEKIGEVSKVASLTLNSGTLNITKSVFVGTQSGDSGTLIMNGGTINAKVNDPGIVIGRSGTGYLTMNGGLIDTGYMRTSSVGGSDGGSEILLTGGELRAGRLYLGSASNNSADSMVVDNGGWLNCTNFMRLGELGAAVMTVKDGGTASVVNVLTLGYSGGSSGILNMEGGTLEVGSLAIGRFGSAEINLTGGKLQSNGALTMTAAAVMNISGGELVLGGDQRAAVEDFIQSGNIVYTGSEVGSMMVVEYDGNTTRLFVENKFLPKYLWPANGMELTVDNRYTFQLNWQAGELATDIDGYNVYVADSNSVPLELVSDAITPYTGTTWQITDAVLGSEYSWRIDTVLADGAGVVLGDVWTVQVGAQLLSVYEVAHNNDYYILDWQWIACGDGVSWNDELNWHSEVAGEPIPTFNDYTGTRTSSLMPGVINISGGNNSAGNVWLGLEGNSQAINVKNNAQWQTYRVYAYAPATINIEKGSSCQWEISMISGGVVNLEGKMRFTSGQFMTIKKSGSRGGIKISNGGELWLTKESLASTANPFNIGEVGNIDIYDGTLKVQGEHLSIVSGWVDAGHIIPYGNNESNAIVDVYYIEELNQTFATARQDKQQAYQGYPNNVTNVAADAQLSWIVGDDVDSDTLYMAVVPKADLNRDDAVDIDDLLILAEYFLDDSWFALNVADINNDYEVNLRDFAEIGSSWLRPIAYQEIDTFTRDPNNGDIGPGELFTYDATLDYNTEYRWRVDSNAGDVYSSQVWTFKTGANPSLAFNQYPVNGDKNITETAVALEWEVPAGIGSADVYFGATYGEVANATTSSTAYKTTTSSNTWTTPTLEVGGRYYWRIDTIEGATTHKGKVWTFMTTDIPMGLYVDGGVLKLGGSEFKGYGVNYVNPFTKTLASNEDTSYQEGFATLAAYNIPFVRMWGSGFYLNNWALYFENKELYFELFDNVMASAEDNGVGIVISAFWSWFTLPDVVGQTVTDWTDPTSEVSLFMENYIREIYQRYKNNPYFWGWELGNEYNYSAENQSLAPDGLTGQGHPTVRTEDDRITMAKVRAISANFAAAVRKVDKNRIVTSGFGIRRDVATNGYGNLPERYEDHEYSDVASIHYYPAEADISSVSTAVADTAVWGKPIFVGEFGISENNLAGFATVEEAFTDTINGMQNAGVIFAAVWVYNYREGDPWNITATNNRSYMLDQLEAANAAMNQ